MSHAFCVAHTLPRPLWPACADHQQLGSKGGMVPNASPIQKAVDLSNATACKAQLIVIHSQQTTTVKIIVASPVGGIAVPV